MINFCPPGIPITARRALKNVLQSRRIYQSRGRRFFHSPRCDRALPRYLRYLPKPPAAFTQNELLSPDEFVKRAGERGVQLRAEHLLELHRRRALVPLLRITQHPPKSSEVVAIPATAANAYHQFRSPMRW
jgi:hypothetical protein